MKKQGNGTDIQITPKTPLQSQKARHRRRVFRLRWQGRQVARHNLKSKTRKWQARVPLLTVLAALIVITLVLFVPPYVGMEDNGDFGRVSRVEGLYDLPENSEFTYNGYFVREYGIMQYYNEYSTSVHSSLALFVKPAVALDRLLTGNDSVFDIRFLAAIFTAYFLAILYFLMDYFTHRLSLAASILIGAACVFVFADTGNTAYFNSFFAEPLAYISMLGCITCALLFSEGRGNKYALLAGFLANGVILTFSKQQFAPVGVLLAIVCLFFFLKAQGRAFKCMIAASACALGLTGAITYLLIPQEFTNINAYHAMTRGAMMVSEDPPKTLEWFGIEEKYELLDGTIYFDRYPQIHPEDELLKENVYPRYSTASIAQYYMTHPDDFSEMLKLAASAATHVRPTLGNYEYTSGRPPNTLSDTFSLYSAFKSNFMPKTLGYIVIWIVVALGLLYKKRLKQLVVCGFIVVGLSQLLVSVIGAGDADLAKHIFLYNAVFDVVHVILFAHIVRFIEERYLASRQRAAQANNMEREVYKNT